MSTPAYLNALRAFEAAARHQSFSAAAEELNVTSAAVGQQVRSLESWLGVTLFTRATSGSVRLVLTDVARAAMPDIREGFDRLRAGLARLKEASSDTELTVTLSPAFAGKWLLPRLERFQQSHPDIDVLLNTNLKPLNYLAESIDIGVRYGTGTWAGLSAIKLMDEELFPVCSPRLASLVAGRLSLDSLADCTLIHDLSMAGDPGFPTWRTWLESMGLTGIDASHGLRINNSAAVLQAAIEGQGVALGRSVMVRDDLASGRLVRPFGPVKNPLALAYYVVCRPECAELEKVQAFQAWLLAEARRDGAQA